MCLFYVSKQYVRIHLISVLGQVPFFFLKLLYEFFIVTCFFSLMYFVTAIRSIFSYFIGVVLNLELSLIIFSVIRFKLLKNKSELLLNTNWELLIRVSLLGFLTIIQGNVC